MAIQEVVSPSLTRPDRLRMSYEEYLQWVDEDTHSEWVEGEVIVHMPAKDIHQATLGFLYRLLALFVDVFALGRLRTAPFEVKIRPGRSSREPDILFIANKNLDRLSNDRFVGPPDLIVEIVSADSLQRDRRDKFNEYREAGVPEYWIIDPRRNKQRADFYALNEQGQYDLFATEEDERVGSPILPGFWLKPDWLWEPDADPQLRFYEMAGMAAETIEQIRQQLQAGLKPGDGGSG
jgi:Uma2 family endonuclease